MSTPIGAAGTALSSPFALNLYFKPENDNATNYSFMSASAIHGISTNPFSQINNNNGTNQSASSPKPSRFASSSPNQNNNNTRKQHQQQQQQQQQQAQHPRNRRRNLRRKKSCTRTRLALAAVLCSLGLLSSYAARPPGAGTVGGMPPWLLITSVIAGTAGAIKLAQT